MTTSARSSGRSANAARGAGVVWLLASGLVAACSLLAPSDEHYVTGPSLANSAGAENGEGGEGGEGGQAGRAAAEAGAGGDVGGGMSNAGGNSGVGGSAGGGGVSGSPAGGSSGGKATLVCSGNFADCNHEASDGCEADLSSSSANCGGCGEAFACTDDQVCEHGTCISQSGCSDGTREGFLPLSTWPRLAGCTAKWPRSSLRAAKTGHACGFESDVCAVPADACGVGWHVCAIPPFLPTEVSEQATAKECSAQPGAFAIAVGDQNCEPCTDIGDGAACCGDRCLQQSGNCIYPGSTPWFGVINQYKNLCGAIESALAQHGVLCCRAP